MEGISMYSVRKTTFIVKTLKILLVCWSNNSSHQTFYDLIFDIAQSYCSDIIQCDFNVDAYDSEEANLEKVT